MKYIRKSVHPSIPVLRTDSCEASCHVEKATLLNQVILRNFYNDVEPLTVSNSFQFASDPLSSVSEDTLCTESDVFHLLCAVDTTKASGPDGVSGYMLKGSAEFIAFSLAHLFNMSIKFGRVPLHGKCPLLCQFQKRPIVLHIINQFHYFH